MGAVSGISSVVMLLSGFRSSTYGVNSQPAIGMSEGKCVLRTDSISFEIEFYPTNYLPKDPSNWGASQNAIPHHPAAKNSKSIMDADLSPRKP